MVREKNIILTGMPAAGKSTVGVILAKKLGFSFLDTDVFIQTQEKRLLSDIIVAEGIDGFLALEETYVVSLSERSCVIATGGSVVYGKTAMEHLSGTGVIVYLKTPINHLLGRLVNLDKRGVVRRPGQSFEALYREREPLYTASADIVIDCSLLSSPVETADEIIRALGVDR